MQHYTDLHTCVTLHYPLMSMWILAVPNVKHMRTSLQAQDLNLKRWLGREVEIVKYFPFFPVYSSPQSKILLKFEEFWLVLQLAKNKNKNGGRGEKCGQYFPLIFQIWNVEHFSPAQFINFLTPFLLILREEIAVLITDQTEFLSKCSRLPSWQRAVHGCCWVPSTPINNSGNWGHAAPHRIGPMTTLNKTLLVWLFHAVNVRSKKRSAPPPNGPRTYNRP